MSIDGAGNRNVGSVVVLGGTGFVGRHVCAAFAARGHEVTVASRHLPRYGPPHRHLCLDLAVTPVDVIAEVLEAWRPHTVVNATGGIWGLTDAGMWDAIAAPALRVVQAMSLLSGRPRLVHLGSVLEYGPLPWGASAGPATPPRPRSAYGRAKLAGTHAAMAAAAEGRVDAVALRVANVAGPGTPAASVLGRVAEALLDAAARDRPAEVTLDPLRAHRDYVDVRDVADAVVAAASASVETVSAAASTGAVIGIGRGQAVPVRSLVDLLIEVSGVPAGVVERSPRSAGALAHSTENWMQVNPRPAAEMLGWRPRRGLAEAVRGYWDEIAQRTGPGRRSSGVAPVFEGPRSP